MGAGTITIAPYASTTSSRLTPVHLTAPLTNGNMADRLQPAGGLLAVCMVRRWTDCCGAAPTPGGRAATEDGADGGPILGNKIVVGTSSSYL